MSPDFRFMKDSVAAELATMLVETRSMSFEQALDTLLNSETYQKLSNPETGLYYQSPLYVYDYLQNELLTGKLA